MTYQQVKCPSGESALGYVFSTSWCEKEEKTNQRSKCMRSSHLHSRERGTIKPAERKTPKIKRFQNAITKTIMTLKGSTQMCQHEQSRTPPVTVLLCLACLMHPPVRVDPEHVEQLLSSLRVPLLVLLHHVTHGNVRLEGNPMSCKAKKTPQGQHEINFNG